MAARRSAPVAVRRKRSSPRREMILRTASALLRERGHGLSLREIGEELGITYNALYHHFRSREDLILHCLLRGMDVIEGALERSDAAGGTGLDKLSRFLDDFLASVTEAVTPPGHLGLGLVGPGQRVLARRARSIRDGVEAFVAQGVRDGSIAACDPLVAASWVLHALFWMPEEIYRERDPEAVCHGIFELILRGLAGAPSHA